MDRAGEVTFAWELLDAARGFLDESAHSWLCAKLGAGETQCVTRDLLAGFVSSGTALPAVLAASLWSWVNGFRGSDEESSIRDVVARIKMVEIADTEPERVPPIARLAARRSDRLMQTTLMLVPGEV